LILAVLPAAAAWQGRESSRDGVLHVENPAAPLHPPVTLTLEELWRVGGDSEEEGEFFGVIVDVAVDSDGAAYLLDRQLAEINVFSAEGEWQRTIGREGEGPGEFRNPQGLFFLPDAQLAVVQRRPSRLVLLTPDGLPGGNLPVPSPEDGGLRSLQEGACAGDAIVLMGNNFVFEEGRMERSRRLIAVDQAGGLTKLYHESARVTNMANPVVLEDDGLTVIWTLLPDGTLVASTNYDYRLQFWRPGGDKDRIVMREHEPYLRSDEEMEERRRYLESRVRFRGRRHGITPEIEVTDRERGIWWLGTDGDGYLWVMTGRGVKEVPAGVLGTFDVFDSEGRYLQAVTLAGEGDFERDRILLREGRLYVLTQYQSALMSMFGRETEEEEVEEEEEAVPMSVVCYRLDWSPPSAD